MKYFAFLALICAVFINQSAFADRAIILNEQIDGVLSMDGKFKLSIVIYANAIIGLNTNKNNLKITTPKMNLIVMDVSNQTSWEVSVGSIPMPDGKFINIKMEDVVIVKKSETTVEISTDFNDLKKIIISIEDFIKLNHAIEKNKDIPAKINDSWVKLVENWK